MKNYLGLVGERQRCSTQMHEAPAAAFGKRCYPTHWLHSAAAASFGAQSACSLQLCSLQFQLK